MLKNKDNQFAWRFIRCKKVMFLIKKSQFKNVYNNATYRSVALCINACIISVNQLKKITVRCLNVCSNYLKISHVIVVILSDSCK